MEADRLWFKYAVGAGYDKDQVGKFHEKLLETERNASKRGSAVVQSLSDALSTAPSQRGEGSANERISREEPR